MSARKRLRINWIKQLWIDKFPARRENLIELATIQLRQQFTHAQIMEMIDKRELDPIVDRLLMFLKTDVLKGNGPRMIAE